MITLDTIKASASATQNAKPKKATNTMPMLKQLNHDTVQFSGMFSSVPKTSSKYVKQEAYDAVCTFLEKNKGTKEGNLVKYVKEMFDKGFNTPLFGQIQGSAMHVGKGSKELMDIVDLSSKSVIKANKQDAGGIEFCLRDVMNKIGGEALRKAN